MAKGGARGCKGCGKPGANRPGGLCYDCYTTQPIPAEEEVKVEEEQVKEEAVEEVEEKVEAVTREEGPMAWMAMQHVIREIKDKTPFQRAMRVFMKKNPGEFAKQYAALEEKYQPVKAEKDEEYLEDEASDRLEALCQELLDKANGKIPS